MMNRLKLIGKAKCIKEKCKSSLTQNKENNGSESSDYDEIDERENEWRNKLKRFLEVLLLLTGVVWLYVAFYAITTGNVSRLWHPTNSKGDSCGKAGNAAKPNLFYFDVTQCAGLQADVSVCPTSSICVENCPKTYWTAGKGMNPALEQFCENLSGWNDTALSISELVADRSCPAYTLPSTSVIGRCVPFYGSVRRKEIGSAEAKLKSIKTADGKKLHRISLLAGVEYVINSINDRGYDENLLASHADYWLTVQMTFLLRILLSSIWILLVSLAPKAVLWSSILFSFVLSVAGAVAFLMLGTFTERNDQDQIFIPPAIINLTNTHLNKSWCLVIGSLMGIIALLILFSVTFFEKIKDSINHISDKISANLTPTLLIFIPIVHNFVRLVVIDIFLLVATFLSTLGTPVYRVVNACSSEICLNMESWSTFVENDVCDQKTFHECTGCPEAQCVFHRFEPTSYGYILHAYNLLAMVLMLLFVRRLMSRDIPDQVHYVPNGLPKVFILLTVKLCISGIAVGAAMLFIFNQPAENPLEIHVKYEFSLFLVVFLGMFTFSSPFRDTIFLKYSSKQDQNIKLEQRGKDSESTNDIDSDPITQRLYLPDEIVI